MIDGDDVRADRVAMALLNARIAVSTAEPFATDDHVPHALRLALGSVPQDQLKVALERVRQEIEVFAL